MLHIEASLSKNCVINHEELKVRLREWLVARGFAQNDIPVSPQELGQTDAVLAASVDRLSMSRWDTTLGQSVEVTSKTEMEIFPYQLFSEGPTEQEVEEGGEEVAGGTNWILPNVEFEDLWDSLHFDTDIKARITNYVKSMLVFSDRGVNNSIICCNRLMLLHGPPGTGKTTLCKAVAQKLCIRLVNRYRYGQLIEINSHSLFSKWFSESGKLVMKIFNRIHEMVDEPDALVFVLIDEVESLTAARKASIAGNEPSDSLRVVNALLTQIDALRRLPNVLILTTSNLTQSIDAAFLDRADLKLFVGHPSAYAVYEIYCSCIRELKKARIIQETGEALAGAYRFNVLDPTISSESRYLMEISKKSLGISGRTLRKLPVLAHAYHLQKTEATLAEFLTALELALTMHRRDTQLAEDAALSTEMENKLCISEGEGDCCKIKTSRQAPSSPIKPCGL